MAENVSGRVVAIGSKGDLITDIPLDKLSAAPRDESVRIVCDEIETRGLYPPDHTQPEMTFLAILAASNVLELSLVGESASGFFSLKVGARVSVSW